MSNQEKPPPMDLMFSKAAKGCWVSRNNNYSITRNGLRDFSVHGYQLTTNGFTSIQDAEEWASWDQIRRLGQISDGYDLFVVSADGSEMCVGHEDDLSEVILWVFEQAEEMKRQGCSPRVVAL